MRRCPTAIPTSASAGGRDIRQQQAKDGPEQQPGGVAKLGEGAAGDHAADFGETAVGPDAARSGLRPSQTRPPAARTDAASEQSSISSPRIRSMPPARSSVAASHEHAAARRARAPGRWIELKEKEDECGDQRALGDVPQCSVAMYETRS